MKPWLGEEEAEAAADAVRSGWVAQGPRVAAVRAGVRGAASAPRTASRSARARPACTWRCVAARRRPRRRGDRARRCRSSPPPTPSATSARRRSSPTSNWPPATSRVDTIDAVHHPAHQGGHRSCTRAACRVDLDAIRALCDPLRHRRGRGRRLRHRLHLRRAAGRRRRRHRRLLVPPPQAHHHRRGRHGHRRRPEAWASRAAAAARARHERQRRRPARAAAASSIEQYLEIGFNYRMTDIQAADRARAARPARRDRRPPPRARRALPGSCSPTSPASTTVARPGLRHDQLPVVLGAARPTTCPSPATSCWRRSPTPASRRGAGIMAAHLEPAYADHPHVPLPGHRAAHPRLADPAAVPRADRGRPGPGDRGLPCRRRLPDGPAPAEPTTAAMVAS